MSCANAITGAQSTFCLDGISARIEGRLVILSPIGRKAFRRVLFVNSYGGLDTWEKVRQRLTPTHHLWGCIEMVLKGYEVALAEPLRHFNPRRPIPHDIQLLTTARAWLGRDDILYCAHTLLYWTGLAKLAHLARFRVVSLVYAGETLDFARAHSAIIALTPTAERNARQLAPKVRVSHLGWGADLSFFPQLPYQPTWFLSCGITHRDHLTLCSAASSTRSHIKIVSPNLPHGLKWPPNVTLLTGGRHDDTLRHHELLLNGYGQCSASLIILKDDPSHRTAVGFTNLLEAMAMGRPVIVSRTGALASEIDVEAIGCGLHVPAGDAGRLAAAIDAIALDPRQGERMGRQGRRLAESHYNINRYAHDLHELFESL